MTMPFSGEWELDPNEIAAIFRAKGWKYHTNQGLMAPDADVIEAQITGLVTEILKKDVVGVQGGRFMVWKDPELPNSYDIYLNLGYVWDEDELGAEGALA